MLTRDFRRLQLRIARRCRVLQDGEGVLRFRLSDLQLDSAEYVGMPAADAKHVFIIREAFDVSRFQALRASRNSGWL